ncbi:hypothetical protein J2X04_000222 [Lysobacter niabensis]|uniref:Secreted protein n=1 Tax=Agrilutibacter niabensis TaxID=380628 RepID=A0ABU1VKJ9_9GAMM|nr:hypothetical protein [Lysobacter niabensis]MDR7097875.1 hypothetical protein [Lysobacter niabensis]
MVRQMLLGAALTLAAAMPAQAQDSSVRLEQRLSREEMHEAGLDTLTPAQLAALNRLLVEKAATPASVPPASAPAYTAAATDQSHTYIGLDDKPIRSRVKGSVAGWEPGTVFSLENGQQWKVLKGSMKLRAPMEAPEIVVVPGIAGRWFLQVDEDLPKARVYRID